MDLGKDGFALHAGEVSSGVLEALRHALFQNARAGARCLLDEPLVLSTAQVLRDHLCASGLLPATARAIQAIAFDKTPDANWKVTWHQDVMFPFARPVISAGYDLPSMKEGVDYARPPRQVLEELLAVRLHLDDCDSTNGPLKVSPHSHLHGILHSTEIPACAAQHGETACLASEGDLLIFKPLLLHASSPATAPKHRRVLHLVYHTGQPMSEPWHRSV